MLTGLVDHIRKYVSLNAEEEEILVSHFRHGQFMKKEYVLKDGQVCDANYFVLKGCLRLYVITDKGTEQIIQFAIENWWISDYNSLERRTPSGFNIQAVEDTELLWIDKREQDLLFKKMPQLEKYFRVVFQKAYAASLLKIQYIYCMTAEERYHQFSRSFPEFVQRIPQYMLASFLGFTPEFLSKARAKKRTG